MKATKRELKLVKKYVKFNYDLRTNLGKKMVEVYLRDLFGRTLHKEEGDKYDFNIHEESPVIGSPNFLSRKS